MAAQDQGPQPDPLGLLNLYDSNRSWRMDIVAVHDFNGGSLKSWGKSPENGLVWLRDYLPYEISDEISDARIFTFGYRSDGNTRLKVVAEEFLSQVCIIRKKNT